MTAFPKLFEPVSIGGLKLKNRVVMPAMATNLASPSGEVTDQLVGYHAERAKGGVGLIITEITAVAAGGASVRNQLSAYDDSFLQGMERLATAVHAATGKIAMQLFHAGRRAVDAAVPAGPSPIAALGGPPVRELTLTEIEALVEAFGSAARRARAAGFDAVELHCTHGYLIAQFFSSLTNKRTDRYGGSLENRMRFGFEALAAARREAGTDFPVICRITGEDNIAGGSSLEEARAFARGLQQGGADAIHVSGGGIPSTLEELRSQTWGNGPVLGEPPGALLRLAQGVKQAVTIPVIAVGRINGPALAEQIIAEGKADLVAVGRCHIADPHWVKKAAAGRPEDIRVCLACAECNDSVIAKRGPLRCAVNPVVGRDQTTDAATDSKRVVVIGGGPAGMEAALAAVERGHIVTLYEKGARLGGALLAASVSTGKDSLREFAAWQERQLRAKGVELVLTHDITAEEIAGLHPDAVILAAGATPALPPIPGVDKEIVTNGVDVLLGKRAPGEWPIVVGGGMVGCETAAYLAHRGKRVRLVTRRGEDGLAIGMSVRARQWFLSSVWRNLGVEVLPHCQFAEVVDEGLIVINREGALRLIEGDMVVFCTGMASRNGLAQALQRKVAQFEVVGDCREPRNIMEAVREGYEAGMKI
ncbi:MAG: FAD-dependent oxidoreductase [Chloroflexi bacterium]|nr:FAD-dependent oxidoreductase [Chloroflexota bacterium]